MTLFIAITLMLAAFYALAVVTEDYFVPSIDILSKKLKLSSDASGATLLAIGSSAPEFFTSIIAVFGLAGSTQAYVGAGTIVGSALFNVLVIIGATALFKVVVLQWKPVIRDLSFYILTIILLLFAFYDGRIVFYEALIFVLVYCLYVFVDANWHKWFNYNEVPAPEEHIEKPRNILNSTSHKLIGFLYQILIKNKGYTLLHLLSLS